MSFGGLCSVITGISDSGLDNIALSDAMKRANF